MWAEDIDAHWDFAAPLIQQALDKTRGEETLESVKHDLKAKDSQLWIIGESGACVTTIEQYPNKRILRACQLGGRNMNDWITGLVQVLIIFAKENDCDHFDIVGRDGWVKQLKQLGFEKQYTVTSYELRRK